MKRLALALLLVLLACNAVAAQEGLTVWVSSEGWAGPQVMEEIGRQFAAAHPEWNVQVHIESGSIQTYTERLKIAIAADSGPDAAFYNRAWVIEDAALLDPFLPLDEILGDELISRLIPSFVEEVSFGGRIYGLPFAADMRGILWNVDHFNESGLDASRPPTFAELDAYDQKLTRYEGGELSRVGFLPWGNNWFVQGWYFTFGTNFFDWETARATVDTPEAARLFEYFEEYAVRYPNASRFANLSRSFAEGLRSIILSHTGYPRDLREQFGVSFAFDGGPAPYPEWGQSGTWAGGGAYVIPKGVRNLEGASEFLRFLGTEEVMIQFHEAIQSIAPHLGALRAMRFHDPVVSNIIADAPNLNPRPPLWGHFNRTLNQARDKVIAKTASIADALAEAQSAMDSAIAESGLAEKWGR